MVSQIQATDNVIRQVIDPNKPSGLSFGSVATTNQPDTFEKQSGQNKKQGNGLEIVFGVIAGVFAVAYGVAKHKCGELSNNLNKLQHTHAKMRNNLSNILKTVGESAPKDETKRIAKISDLTSKDGMTGLFNKPNLMTNISRDFESAMKKGENFSVAMLDMDNFKSVNEVFDHSTGDKVLKRISANIREISEKYRAKGYRYGGEEFVVIMNGQDSKKAKEVLEEISKAIENDKGIQDYLPEFMEKATEKYKIVNSQLSAMESFLPKLRNGENISNCKEIAENIVTVLKEHVHKFKPGDTTVIDEIIKKLQSASAEELPNILKSSEKYSNKCTLGEELNKIYFQYKAKNNDLEKWIKHIVDKNMFTVSGGVVSSECAQEVKDGKLFIKIADEALNASKENGKAQVTQANEEIIKKIIEKNK